MTLVELLKENMHKVPFRYRRKEWAEGAHIICRGESEDICNEFTGFLTYEDVLANDWELMG